jgi:hypothetical protein
VGCLLAVSAPRAEDQPKTVDIRNLSCGDFMALPDDVRPVVAAWVHGYTRAGGESWVYTVGDGRAFVASLQDKCTQAPNASFRYKVLETAKERQAARKAAKK